MTDKKLKKPENSQNRFSPEYMAYLKELESMNPETYAGQIAKLARNGKLETEVLKQLRETLRDPNKMEKKEYKHFMKALSLGKFPKKGKHVLRFIQALNGTPKEKEFATDFLKRLSEESTSPLTERTEKDALKKLTDLRDEDLAIQAVTETSAAAQTITGVADIHSLVEKASETTRSNWKIEQLPEALVEELDRLETEQAALATKSNEVDRQYRLAKSAEKPDKTLIERLKRELIKLDNEFDKLQQKLKKPRLQERQWLAGNLARLRALEFFFKRTGVDVQTAERLRMWFLDLSRSRGQQDSKTSLKMMGLEIDPITGKAQKKEIELQITGLRFDKTDREGFEEEAAGELIIEYVNEKGENKVESYKNFLQMINAFEGYEEIDSLAELNKRSSEEFGYAALAVGQEFKAETLVGYDKEHRPVMQKRQFKIEAVDEAKKTISLDQTVTKIPRAWLENSVDNSLYFDRKQREFNFGEFAKFVKQHGFQRKVAIDETAEICAAARAKLRAQCADFAKGSTEPRQARFERIGGTDMPKFDPPKTGEEKEVIFLDNNGLLHWGKIKREKETHVLEELPNHFRNGNAGVQEMLEAGIPSHFAYAGRAAGTHSSPKTLTPLELARMVREGSIMNAPTTRPTGKGKWTLIEQPDQIAAMTMANKHATGEGEELQQAHEGEQAHAHEAEQAHAHEQEHGHEEGHDEHAKKKYYEEALPLNQVNKIGGMKYKEKSFLKALWNDTRFFSMNDCWKMGKAMWEYYDRRWERRQKDKFARVGEELPYFSPEMRRIVESTEHEEVHQYQEAFEHKGIYEVQYRLENTGNRDEFKAAFVTLSDKGQLRWDSIELWRNINKFIIPRLSIPIPSNGDPNTRVSKDDRRTGFDFLKPAIDSLWGEGTYDGFYSKNKSAYASNSKGFYEEGKQLEGVDGGHELRLSTLLRQHKEGIYVNPHEYEGLILHSIEAGKSNMQSKIYFMIEGVAATNHEGRTIMPFDRIAHINSEMLNAFPILEYICAKVPRGPDGEKKFRWTLDDYKQWVNWFDDGHPGDPTKFAPGKAVDEFMWKYVIPSDETQNRINKALRNGEKLDHDDMFAYLPPATFEVVNDACKATTGSKKFLTIEGYANVFPGFSQYMRSVANKGARTKLREAIKSYVRFEGIMTNRYQKTSSSNDPYQRMSDQTLSTGTIVTDTPPQAFINQTNNAIQEIATAYGDKELEKLAAIIYEPEVEDIYSEDGKKEQNIKNLAFEQFNKVFDRVVKSDNGEKMEMIIKKANFEGMPYKSSEEQSKRKAAFTDKMALD
ncbi:hypothetical protein HZA40_03095 [Candidatus Peregrinibacteria bacterium]|nr:hypothetical protein [Candidatus Peregrinibacteria bacterium]